MRPNAPNPFTWWFLTKLVHLSFYTLSHLLWWFQTSYLLMTNCFNQPSKDNRNVLSARAISYIESEVIRSLLGEEKLGSYQPPLVDNQPKKLESRLDSPSHICQILSVSNPEFLYPFPPLQHPCHTPVSCLHHLLCELIQIACFCMQFAVQLHPLENHHDVLKNAGLITQFSCLKPVSGFPVSLEWRQEPP